MSAFGPLSALFRDTDRPRAPDAETAWYAERIGTTSLALDAMCGWGRLLVPLAQVGCKVHGVDASAAMLARCDARIADAGLAATTVRQDIVHLNVPFRYGSAFIADAAFQWLTDPSAAAAALERVRAHLVGPGRLFIACHVPPTSLQRAGAPLVDVRTLKLPDGTQIALRSEAIWTQDAQMMNAALRYTHRRGAQPLAEEHERLAATWYGQEDCAALVRAAGFRDVTIEPGPGCDREGESFVVAARL
jgi:ubiquinone/menaquinone biosynthesis C-methylase UbiE